MKIQSVLLWFLVLAGCASSPTTRFFVLEPAPTFAARPVPSGASLTVGAIEIPAYLDRPEIVRRAGRNRLDISASDRWGAPLGPMIRRVLTVDLARRLPQSTVVQHDRSGTGSSMRVLMVSIDRFGVDPSDEVELNARWKLLGAQHEEALKHREESIAFASSGNGTAAQVHGMSRALGLLADRIVAALANQRQSATGNPASARLSQY